jgi:homospermidine synthase
MERRTRTVAPHGQKMIELTIRFWTNKISKKRGHIVKKECWDAGVVYMHENPAHGITSANPMPFHSLLDLPAKIEKLLIRHKVKTHRSNQSRKYIRR